MRVLFYTAAATVLAATAAVADVKHVGTATVYTAPNGAAASSSAGIDYANAQPMRMPAASTLPPSATDAVRQARDPVLNFGQPGVSPGARGTGE